MAGSLSVATTAVSYLRECTHKLGERKLIVQTACCIIIKLRNVYTAVEVHLFYSVALARKEQDLNRNCTGHEMPVPFLSVEFVKKILFWGGGSNK
jgi:hypothetical protein